MKHLETYGFAEADLLSLKTKLKTYRRSSLRGKLNALSKKPFEKWLRQSPIRVNPRNPCLKNSCSFVVNSNFLRALVPLWLNISVPSATSAVEI
jgi:hypothetical protein